MNAENKEFASIYKSMESCFQIILGKFNSDAFVDSKSFSSEPMFVAYNVIILFIMVNLMVAILVNGFDLARNDNDLNNVDVDVLAYIKDNIPVVNPFVSKIQNKIGTKHVYIDFTKSFEIRIDRHLKILKKVILMVLKSKLIFNR